MGKTNYVFGTLHFNPWGVLDTWLYIGLLKKYKKNELTTHFEQKFAIGSYGVEI
jgi:hypothetical protein